jgi:starch synthase
MHCIHVASELAPIAKVGGLGDVLSGLCREISWKGHDVSIIIPKYDCMDSDEIGNLTIHTPDLLTYYEDEYHRNTVWVGWVENLQVYFIEPHHPRFFFNRGCFYGCEDDIERYLYFSRAVLEFLFTIDLKPDILHIHDWQTASIAVLYKDIFVPMGYQSPKIIFTIHNIEYQGKCAPEDLDRIGLVGLNYLTPTELQDNYYPETINLLKGAIVYADFVTTVSPTYSQEVKTPLGGRGLDATIVEHEKKFTGILNGVDYSYWNPEIDRYLPAHFSSRQVPANAKDRNTIDKKAYIKRLFRERYLTAEQSKPLIGCVARLVPQKGIELIKDALHFALENGGQFVLLGSSPIPSIDKDFQELKQRYLDNPNVHLILHHQEETAHLIFGASDIFIVPSLFEPCGLTQLIALKYGAVPVVRRTGGLADTIVDVDTSHQPFEKTNGFVFDSPEKSGITSALRRAFDCWFHYPDKWHKLMINGMNFDYSWNIPSNAYLEIYYRMIQKTRI